MSNLGLLKPELFLAAWALLLLGADAASRAVRRRWLYGAAMLGLLGALALVLPTLRAGHGVGALWTVDAYSQALKAAVLASTALCLLLGFEYEPLPEKHAGTFSALLLFSAVGLMAILSAADLLFLFVGLELVSISSFVLAGFERANPKSNEGAIKYFLFGAFSSAILVYGISLYYGAAGTTLLTAATAPSPLLTLALVLIFLGLAFKASLAPMHWWVPDAYEGAPTPVTAFLSIAPKIATLGVLVRLFGVLHPAAGGDLSAVLALSAFLTMAFGNFTALFQTDVKRLLAYSSVAQAGYLLIGLAVGTPLGLEGTLLYSLVYIPMNVGAFAVAQAAGRSAGHYGLSAFDGLYKRSFGLALAMTLCLLSLAGIPPLSGFIGKLYIFSSAMQAGQYWLAVAGVLNSVVSVYYYFLIARRMFFAEPADSSPLPAGPCVLAGTAAALAGVLLLGLHPEPLIAGVRASVRFLP